MCEMRKSPLGYRVRTDYNLLAQVKISRVGVSGQWSSYKSLVTKKLVAAINSGDIKRQKQIYSLMILMMDNQRFSNYLNSKGSIEYKLDYPEFEAAISTFKSSVMNK